MNLQFYLRFHTRFGESLWICGNTEELGMNDPKKAIAMEYLNDEFWHSAIEIHKKNWPRNGVNYKYYLKGTEGQLIGEWGFDRMAGSGNKGASEIQLIDTWNHAGEYENAFFTAPFNNVLLKHSQSKSKHHKTGKHYTHTFKIKAPLLSKHEVVCLSGSSETLGNWSKQNMIQLSKEEDWWTVSLDMSGSFFPVAYKYGVFDTKEEVFVRYETGDNRLLHGDMPMHRVTILHDGFIRLPNDGWKGAGVAIPVFSLRSKNSFGVGEFSDIKLLVDWAKGTGLKLIQLLPINDTMATNTWMDSYP